MQALEKEASNNMSNLSFHFKAKKSRIYRHKQKETKSRINKTEIRKINVTKENCTDSAHIKMAVRK